MTTHSTAKKITKGKRAKYRSGLERKIALSLHRRGIKFFYEEEDIDFIIPARYASYTPDFPLLTRNGKKIFVEAKGIWDAQDRYKHLLIKQQHSELDIRFVFTNSKTRISKKSATTYADICEGRGRGDFKGMTWLYADKRVPDEWLKESN